jgi:hypothetical protein
MTGLINGLHDASWQLAGMRQPTAWEHRVSNGRSFFYSTTVAEEHQREQYHLLEPEKAMDVTMRLIETERILAGIEDEEPLARTWSQQHEITEVAGRLTPDELTDLFGLAAATAYLSDELTDTFGRAAKSARQQALPLVPKTTIEGSEGNKARQAIRQIAHTEFQLSAQLPKIRQWKAKINQLCGWLRTDKSNSALLSRLAYTARLYAVDPDAGIEELKASAKCLKIDPAALSA